MKTGKKLIENVLECAVPQQDAAFWWMGQLGFLVKTAHFILAIDCYITPGADRLVDSPLDAGELDFADFVFGTHDHLDHIDHPAWKIIAERSPKTRFVVPAMLLSKLSEEMEIPRERFIGIDQNRVFEEENIRISGIPSAHEFLEHSEEGYPYMGYVIEADGIRIYHSGDTCIYEGLRSAVSSYGSIDLMMIPINGRDALRLHRNCIGNMTWQEAADLGGEIKPKLLIPGHYEMFDNNRGDIAAFAAYLEEKYPSQRFWMGPHGERFRLSTLIE